MVSPFKARASYELARGYRLLPFRFTALDHQRYVISNECGEFLVVTRPELLAIADRTLPPESELRKSLGAKHFIFDDASTCAIDLLALKVRSRMERVTEFTALHIFVVTLRCDHACHYCQVSRQNQDKHAFDMTFEHAMKALEFTFRTPSRQIKIEFQGGEPLLNFALIRSVVLRAVELNRQHRKELAFVIATSLSLVDDEMLAFCKQHAIAFSTSLDGPAAIHDKHRVLRGTSSHCAAVEGIERVRSVLGCDAVSALMTTTPESLDKVEAVIDEYVRLGFNSIFLRSLSPYGFAVTTNLVRKYDATRWVDFYKRGLAHILALNEAGRAISEDYTCIILQKMFSPVGTGYVDLQSPCGIGIGAIVFNYDGAVFASDEGRMLAEMNDQSFRLGHLDTDSYQAIMTHEALLGPLEETVLEASPMCTDCAFLPYCGADPVFHKATQQDAVGHKALSAFCAKQMSVVRHIISLLEDNPKARRTMLGWIGQC
jgi:uncharacterized protein